MKKIIFFILTVCLISSLISCQKKAEYEAKPYWYRFDTEEELISYLWTDSQTNGALITPHIRSEAFALKKISTHQSTAKIYYYYIETNGIDSGEKKTEPAEMEILVSKGVGALEEFNPLPFEEMQKVEEGVWLYAYDDIEYWYYNVCGEWIEVAIKGDLEWNSWASLYEYFSFDIHFFPLKPQPEEKAFPWLLVGGIAGGVIAIAVPTTVLLLRARKRRRAQSE